MEILFSYFIFSVGINLFLFLIAYLFQTDKLTDISYSLTFAAIAVYSFIYSEHSIIDIALCVVVLIWAVRLGSYLLFRISVMGHDSRFDDIRKNFLSFFVFWLMQGLTCFIVMLPVILVNMTSGKVWNLYALTALIIAIIGLSIESIADVQKFRFKKNHPSAFMRKGLWSMVQHPNYLGELMFWWAVFLASVPYISWYFGIVGPLWITMIIVGFSGIPVLQKTWRKKYGDDPTFQTYQKSTSKLIPYLY